MEKCQSKWDVIKECNCDILDTFCPLTKPKSTDRHPCPSLFTHCLPHQSILLALHISHPNLSINLIIQIDSILLHPQLGLYQRPVRNPKVNTLRPQGQIYVGLGLSMVPRMANMVRPKCIHAYGSQSSRRRLFPSRGGYCQRLLAHTSKDKYPLVEEVACWGGVDRAVVAGMAQADCLYACGMDCLEMRDEAGHPR